MLLPDALSVNKRRLATPALLNIFFKSFTAERKYYPSYIKLTCEEDYEEVTKAEYISDPEVSIVGVHHSVIEIPKTMRKHELDFLLETLELLDYHLNYLAILLLR